jgi:predicted Zn-ribbon and HTH transcriptional regulator
MSSSPTRGQTVRQELTQALRAGPVTARDLSKAIGVSERDVLAHLPHVARSLRAHGERLRVEPAQCLDCGFEYARREKPARPSQCTRCRGRRITLPRFAIE